MKLLEGENTGEIRNLIQTNEIKFPRLLNKNIQCKNTLFDKITFKNEDGKEFKKFDVLVGNPPWGVNPFEDPSLPAEAEMQLSKDKQKAVTPFQSSQYFTLKAQDFMSEDAITGILTNNSNLSTSKSKPFRQKLLKEYTIKKIYDFRVCNSILFEKRKLKINGVNAKKSPQIEFGTDEPAVALILKTKNLPTSAIEYITPSLNNLTRFLKFVWIKPSDTKIISKQLLIHRYVKKDLRVKAAYDHNGFPFQDNLIGIQFINHDYKFLLSLFNSSLISYFLFFTSAQIGKGTFNMLHKNELESIPVPSEKNIPPEIMFQFNSIIWTYKFISIYPYSN